MSMRVRKAGAAAGRPAGATARLCDQRQRTRAVRTARLRGGRRARRSHRDGVVHRLCQQFPREPSPTKLNMRAPGTYVCGSAVNRAVPTPRNVSGVVSNATSSNPASTNHSRIDTVRSGGLRCRVQMTVAAGAHNAGSIATVRATSSSDTLPKMPHASTTSAGTASTYATVERADDVAPLSRAHADDTDRTRRARVERVTQPVLHDRETALQRRPVLVVRAVPLQ